MNRRGFLIGAGALLMAPAIVRLASIMPVSVLKLGYGRGPWEDGALTARHLMQYQAEFIRSFEERMSLFRVGDHVFDGARTWLVAAEIDDA